MPKHNTPKKRKTSASFEETYPHLSEWVESSGWIEIGQDEMSRSMIRILDEGGLAWEGKTQYSTLDALFQDAENALAREFGDIDDEEDNEDDDEEDDDFSSPPKKTAQSSPQKEQSDAFIEVDSSMIGAVRYNAKAKELDVIYHSGKVWRYSGVSKKVYEGLMQASSKGRYMLSEIIDCYNETPIKLGRRR